MIGRQFTTEKANELEGVFFNEDTFFYFSQDDNKKATSFTSKTL
jgi:hypothetical protein